MANGTRQDGLISTSTDLYTNTVKNGKAFDVHRVTKVEIYDTQEKAEKSENPIQVIPENEVTKVITETGRYLYTVNPVGVAGTYFDKPYVIFENDACQLEQSFIFPFYVRKESYGGSAPGDKESAIIYLNIYDILDRSAYRDNVIVEMNVNGAWCGSDFIKKKSEKFRVNKDGNVVRSEVVNGKKTYIEGMKLLETDTLTDDTFSQTGDDRKVYYNINICGVVSECFEVPKGTLNANYKDLPKIKSELD